MTTKTRTPIKTVAQLKTILAHGDPQDFFINLGGIRSSKGIQLVESRKGSKLARFSILNEIDGTYQTLDETQLFDTSRTHIGYAMERGNFYSY